MLRRLLLLLAVLLAFVSSAAGDFTSGLAAYERGDYARALRECLRKGATDVGYGLNFGIADESPSAVALEFKVSGDGHFKLRRWNGQAWNDLVPWTRDAAIQPGPGGLNRLGVEVDGRTVRLFVNDKLVATTQSPSDVIGHVALYLGARGMEAVFNDLRVTALGGSG